MNSSISEYRMISGFSRLNYDFDGRYLFTATSRYEGTSALKDYRWVGGYQEGGTIGEVVSQPHVRILRDWDDVWATVPNRVDLVANLYGPAVFETFSQEEITGKYPIIRELTLSYMLPESIFSRMGMSSARVNISGENIAYITEYNGWNPEPGGVDSVRYPLPRSFQLGLQVSF